MPLTPRSSALPSPSRGGLSSTSEPQDTIVRSLADWERKQELLERQSVRDLFIMCYGLSVLFAPCRCTNTFYFFQLKLQTLMGFIMNLFQTNTM